MDLVPPSRRLLEEYWSQVIEGFGITGYLVLGIYKEAIEITSTWYSDAIDNHSLVFGKTENYAFLSSAALSCLKWGPWSRGSSDP